MYKDYYQLDPEPFRLTADPRFAFIHQSYSQARIAMQHALEQGEGLLVLNGRSGIGKTTLVEDFVAEMKPDTLTATLISSSHLEGDDLLPMVAHAFGLDPQGMDQGGLLCELEKLLTSHSSALLIIDEAQNLSITALQELGKLANKRANSRALLQVFLLGQSQLQESLHAPEVTPLLPGVTAECTLSPLTLQETRDYVLHRLSCAGWRGQPSISTETFVFMHRFSRGLPRHINAMCTRLFLHGAMEQKSHLDIDDFIVVLESIGEEKLLPASPNLEPASPMRLPPIQELARTKALPLGKRLELTATEQDFIARHPAQAQAPAITRTPSTAAGTADAEATPENKVSTPAGTANLAILTGSRPAKPTKHGYIGYGAAALILLAGGYLFGIPNTDPRPPQFYSAVSAVPSKPADYQIMPANDKAIVNQSIPHIATAVTPAIATAEPQSADITPVTDVDSYPAPTTEPEMTSHQQVTRVEPVETKLLIPVSDGVAAPQSTRDKEIEQLLLLAEQAIARDYLRLSTRGSAWSYYQQVLELDPENPSVERGLQQIATRYSELTRARIYNRQYEKAQEFIERGLSVVPDDNQLLALREEVDAVLALPLAQHLTSISQ